MTQAVSHDAALDLAERRVRYRDLRPCYNAFIDTRSPGSERKENFTIIGPGVSENPEQYVHIAEPHGFNIGGARQPPGCVNSQHSHNTAEVFVIHRGRWRFDFGEEGTDSQLEASAGDVVSFPTGVFRGFTALEAGPNGEPGFLWAVLGGDDPGRVTWAPAVFELADRYGLVLLENGALIDTTKGQPIPDSARRMAPPTRDEIAAMRRIMPEQAESVIYRPSAAGPFGETRIIGPEAPLHPVDTFELSRLLISANDRMSLDAEVPSVLFVQDGAAEVSVGDATIGLVAGDTFSLARGKTNHLTSAEGAVLFLVRGTA